MGTDIQGRLNEVVESEVETMPYVTLPYKPTNGFFDLTEKPKGMSDKTHQKIQLMQMDLVRETPKYKDPEVRKNNWVAYEKLVEYMAELQQIIIINWPHEMLFKGRNDLLSTDATPPERRRSSSNPWESSPEIG